MSTEQIDKRARKLCTHTVVFTAGTDSRVALVMALGGMSTKAVAARLGISEAQAQYRISKGQKPLKTRVRRDYRDGRGPLAEQMLKAVMPIADRFVDRKVTPLFAPLARPGVPRT